MLQVRVGKYGLEIWDTDLRQWRSPGQFEFDGALGASVRAMRRA